MTSIKRLLPLALSTLILLVPVSAAQADRGDLVRIARAELGKNVVERNGDNLPRYRYGQGRIAEYALPGGLPWAMSFASIISQRAGFSAHLKATGTMRTYGGKPATVSVAALRSAAIRNGKLRSSPRPGYLALYGTQHVEIVERVSKKRQLVTIGGNTANRVSRSVNPRGITAYVKPW